MTNATVTDQIISKAAKAKAPTSAKNTEVVAAVQTKLRELGYPSVGPVDGDMTPKGKTEAAILDLRNALDLPLTPTIDKELLKALENAPPKVVPVEQSAATASEIAPKVEAMAQTRWAKFWAKVTAIPSILLTALLALLDQFENAVEKLAPLKNFLGDVPGWVWVGGVGIAASLLAWNLGKAESAMKDGYNRGTVGADNKEAKAKEAE